MVTTWVWALLGTLLDPVAALMDGCVGKTAFFVFLLGAPITGCLRLLVACLFQIASDAARWRQPPWALLVAVLAFELPLKTLVFLMPDTDSYGREWSVLSAYGFSGSDESLVLNLLLVCALLGGLLLQVSVVVELVRGVSARKSPAPVPPWA